MIESIQCCIQCFLWFSLKAVTFILVQVAMTMVSVEPRVTCGSIRTRACDTDVSTTRRRTGWSSGNRRWVRSRGQMISFRLHCCILSVIHIAFYIPGCQGDNGCIKKGSEVSAEGCIKYICNKKGDLEILSVGEFCGNKKGDLEILFV